MATCRRFCPFTHDACGNRTQKETPAETIFFAWDACRKLASVEPPAGAVTMTYNADGRRVQKETATETKKFLFDFERLLQEADGDDVVENTYTSTVEQYGNLLSQFDGTDSLYHQYDALGSTDALLTDAEVAADRYVYRAFGLENHTSGTSDNALTFVGEKNYYRDSETDLYLLDARYYDPDAGRFISEDPIGFDAGDVNQYRYVGNNPVNGIDPSGLQIGFGGGPRVAAGALGAAAGPLIGNVGGSQFSCGGGVIGTAVGFAGGVVSAWNRVRNSCTGTLGGGGLGGIGGLPGPAAVADFLGGGLDFFVNPQHLFGGGLQCAQALGYSTIPAVLSAIQQGLVGSYASLFGLENAQPSSAADLIDLSRSIADHPCLDMLPVPESVVDSLRATVGRWTDEDREGLELLSDPGGLFNLFSDPQFWRGVLEAIIEGAKELWHLIASTLGITCDLSCVVEYLGAFISGIWNEFTRNPLGLIGQMICQMIFPYIGMEREIPEIIGRLIAGFCLGLQGDLRGLRDEHLAAYNIWIGIWERFTFWISMLGAVLAAVTMGISEYVALGLDLGIAGAAFGGQAAQVAFAIYDLCNEPYAAEGPQPYSQEEDDYLQAIAQLPDNERAALEQMADGGAATPAGEAALETLANQLPGIGGEEPEGREKDCRDAAEGILNVAMIAVSTAIGVVTLGFGRVFGPWLRAIVKGIRLGALAIRNVALRVFRGIFKVIRAAAGGIGPVFRGLTVYARRSLRFFGDIIELVFIRRPGQQRVAAIACVNPCNNLMEVLTNPQVADNVRPHVNNYTRVLRDIEAAAAADDYNQVARLVNRHFADVPDQQTRDAIRNALDQDLNENLLFRDIVDDIDLNNPATFLIRPGGDIHGLFGAAPELFDLGEALTNRARQLFDQHVIGRERASVTIAVSRIREGDQWVEVVTVNGGASENVVNRLRQAGVDVQRAPGRADHAETFMYEAFHNENGFEAIGISNRGGPCHDCFPLFRNANFPNLFF